MKFLKGKAYPEVISGHTKSGAMVCIIGQVSELLKMKILEADNTKGNLDKWLMIDKLGRVYEFNSKKEAKEAARIKFGNVTNIKETI